MNHLTHIKNLLVTLKGENQKTVIFVFGISGAGKSTLSKRIGSMLGHQSVIVEFDWYLKESSKIRRNQILAARKSGDPLKIEAAENPKNWYDWDIVESHLERVRLNQKVHFAAAYDQQTGETNLQFTLDPSPSWLIIFEGSAPLMNFAINKYSDIKIAIDTPLEVCNRRFRSRNPTKHSEEYFRHKDYIREVYEYRNFRKLKRDADIILNQKDNHLMIQNLVVEHCNS